MATINTNLTCNLERAVKATYLEGVIFTQDNQANQINVSVYNGSTPVAISGTVSANIIRSDGVTVIATGGSISGNTASITLPAAAYYVPGVVSIIVKLDTSGVVTTLAVIISNVYETTTATVADPGTILPSIADLIAAIDAAVASIPPDYSALWASVATTFDSSEKYVIGQYVDYDGDLYRFTANHSGAWSSSDVVSVSISNDVFNVRNKAQGINGASIKTVVVYEGTPNYKRTFNFNSSATIHNYMDYVGTASTAYTTDVIQIRDAQGNLIYPALDLHGKSEIGNDDQAALMYTFDFDGNFLSTVKYVDFKARSTPFLSTEYYAILVQHPTVYPARYWVTGILNVAWLNPAMQAQGLCSASIKTRVVYDGTPNYKRTFDFDSSATIYNYMDYVGTASTAYTTDVIQIRDARGNLIYPDLDLHDKDGIEPGHEAALLYTFDFNGNYLSTVKYVDFKARSTPFLATEYYVILVQHPTVYPTRFWTVQPEIIEWLLPEYYVGTNGDFATLTEALTALAGNKSPKTIYIEAGTYDIYEEMGGDDYFESLPTLEPADWRTYCKLIPPNTRIVGVGDVTLTFNYSMSKNRSVFSCLNASTGTYIENVNVQQTGGRYGIHFEGATLSETIGNEYTLKNVNVSTDDSYYALGIGMNQYTSLNFFDCMFKSVNNESGYAVYHHTNHHTNEEINVTNCIIDGGIALQNWSSETQGTNSVDVKIKNSYLSKLKIYSVSQSVTVSDYSVTTFGTNQYTLESENVTPVIHAYA